MFTSYIVFGRPNANSFMGNRLQGAPGQACPGVTQVPLKDGYIPVPNKPGLGIELDEEAIKKYPARPWHRGFDYREDGSVAFI